MSTATAREVEPSLGFERLVFFTSLCLTLSDWVTGKFVLDVVEDADADRRLRVVVELAPGVGADAAREPVLAESIRTELLRLNSEFAHYVPEEYQTPLIALREAGDAEYFPPGVKHRYTRPPG